MQYCQGSEKSKRFSPGNDFTEQSFTGELSGVDSAGVLRQGVLFNIFISDIFFFIEKSQIYNFADDNTLYSCNRNLLHIKENLIFNMKNILFWFYIKI